LYGNAELALGKLIDKLKGAQAREFWLRLFLAKKVLLGQGLTNFLKSNHKNDKFIKI